MSDDPDHAENLDLSVRQRRERIEQWRREGERPIARNLAMIGALGWLIVVPTLIGMFTGRWLDAQYGTGIFWTASFLFVGLVIGCWLAWRRVHRE
jgi:ATP synthase protein I